MLEPLDLRADDEELYRALLTTPGATATELAATTARSLEQARSALARLADLRLAQRRPGRPVTFVATSPDVAIGALVNERQAELEQARLAIPDLLAEYQRGNASAEPNGLLEVVTGPGIGHQRLLELQSTATEEILILDKPGTGAPLPGAVELGSEIPMLRRGVRCRGVYELASLELPGQLSYIRRLARLGKQSRVTPRLPIRLVVCDRRLAMLPLAVREPASESVALVSPSALLDALIEVFEDYWQRSAPVRANRRDDVLPNVDPEPADDHEVLHLLATGLKDEAIARQLEVSIRTARRRITALLTNLGVSSRFQAGAEAVRRGLL
jgi:DNA-binding CsgD family transcriptional regulator